MRTPRLLRGILRWFGRTEPRSIDTILAGLLVTIVGGVAVWAIASTLTSSSTPATSHHHAGTSTGSTLASAIAARTRRETTGPGGSATYADYHALTGRGQPIPTNATVRVTCRASGYKVPDGDRWWYRIASKPWNDHYYATTDAFYNNSRTTGSLHGTPLADPHVRQCKP